MFTCVGWQVTLCDPIWQVTPRSSSRALFTFNFNIIKYIRVYKVTVRTSTEAS